MLELFLFKKKNGQEKVFIQSIKYYWLKCACLCVFQCFLCFWQLRFKTLTENKNMVEKLRIKINKNKNESGDDGNEWICFYWTCMYVIRLVDGQKKMFREKRSTREAVLKYAWRFFYLTGNIFSFIFSIGLFLFWSEMLFSFKFH